MKTSWSLARKQWLSIGRPPAAAVAVLLLAACTGNQPGYNPGPYGSAAEGYLYPSQRYYSPPSYYGQPTYPTPPAYAPNPPPAPQPQSGGSWLFPQANAEPARPAPPSPPQPADTSCGWWRLSNLWCTSP